MFNILCILTFLVRVQHFRTQRVPYITYLDTLPVTPRVQQIINNYEQQADPFFLSFSLSLSIYIYIYIYHPSMRNDGLNAHAENSTSNWEYCIYALYVNCPRGVVVAHPPGKWKAQVRFLAVEQQFSYD